MTADNVVCRCGRVAEVADVECSLCGRDLGSLRQVAAPTYPTQGGGASEVPAASYGGARTADSDYNYTYGQAPAQPHQSWPASPAYGWDRAPGRANAPADAAIRRGRDAVLIGVLALAIVVAGLALGYFGLARLLFG